MPGGSVVTTLTQKRAVFPVFSSRDVTLGQMRKIGTHSIIYRFDAALQFMNASCRGVMREERGTVPRSSNHHGGPKSLRGAPRKNNNVTSTFFSTVHLLPKDLRFERGGDKLQTRLVSRAPSNLVPSLA